MHEKSLKYLGNHPPLFLIIESLLFVGFIGCLDYLTGYELAFSIFYLIPISIVAWFVGKNAGITVSLVAMVAWLLADLLTGHTYSIPSIPYWNALVRLGFFLIVTYILTGLHLAQKRREELNQFIVHDLRSPLANIVGGLELLQEILSERDNNAPKELLEMCSSSSHRMLMLINSILDLAQLESKQMSLELTHISVKHLIEQSMREVGMWARRSNISLVFKHDENINTIYADPIITTRIMINLLSNALKFSKPESVVSIQTAVVENNMVAFSIADQGRGISPELIGKVFDKFTGSNLRLRGGSGLGLTFCQKAVEAQKGRIWIESQVNVGTIVTFTLPQYVY